MPRALELDELGPVADGGGQEPSCVTSHDGVFGALDHQARTSDRRGQRAGPPARVQDCPAPGVGEGLGGRLHAPPDGVLDRLGRVGLREHLGEEELQEPEIVSGPVVRVVLGPSHVGFELFVEARDIGKSSRGEWRERGGGTDEDLGRHALRLDPPEMEGVLCAPRQRHRDGALGPGGVQHGEGVRGMDRRPASLSAEPGFRTDDRRRPGPANAIIVRPRGIFELSTRSDAEPGARRPRMCCTSPSFRHAGSFISAAVIDYGPKRATTKPASSTFATAATTHKPRNSSPQSCRPFVFIGMDSVS
jgi:hypothetical protein